MHEFYDQIDEHCEQNAITPDTSMVEPDIGDFCLIKFKGKYNRAIVQETFIDDDLRFCVKLDLCDIGKSTVSETDEIMIMPERLMDFMPPQVDL